MQPELLVTVKVYVFATNPENVVAVPLPVVVEFPGEAIIVHVPVAGKPLNATLPVANVQVGCVITPTKGVEGVLGCAIITALSVVNAEVQPTLFVTVKKYVPAGNPANVVSVPVPVIV